MTAAESSSHPQQPLAQSMALALLTAASDWFWEWDEGGVLRMVQAGRGAVPAVVRACVGLRIDEVGWHFMNRHGQIVSAQALVQARAGFSVRCTIEQGATTLSYDLVGLPAGPPASPPSVAGCARELVFADGAQRHRAMLDGKRPVPDPLLPSWTWDPEVDSISLSPALSRAVPPLASGGARDWWRAILGDDACDLFWLSAQRCREEGEAISLEVQVRSRHGMRWMRLTGSRHAHVRGRVRLDGALEDIHEQRLLRESGEAAAERHRRLFAEMTIACMVYDRQTLSWLEVNPAAEELYGYNHVEFLGMGLREIVDESDHQRLMPATESSRVKGRGGEHWAHRHRDGHRLHVQVKTSDVVWAGRPARMIFVIDASELRATAIEVRMLYECLERARDMVLVTTAVPDAHGNRSIVYVNRAFELKTGYRRHEVLGQDPRLLQGPATSQSTVSTMHSRLARYAPVSVEVINYDKQGNPYWVELSITPVGDDDGRYHYMFSVQRDITQRKLAVAELTDQARELERRVEERTHALAESVKALESFSRSVSHDLLNPVNAVLGFSELVMKNHTSAMPADALRMLTLIRKSGQRMHTIIHDLMNLARVHRMDVRPVRIDVGALAKQLFDALQASQPGRRAILEVSPDAWMLGDLQLFRVILDNLVSNAWKYTGKQTDTVLRLTCRELEGGRLATLADNGAGFDPIAAAGLFGSFKRLHRDSEFAGSGIGLATVALAADRMGGWVWAEAERDCGAKFHVFLPQADQRDVTTQPGDLTASMPLLRTEMEPP